MSISVLITGFLLFFMSLGIHIVIWRWHRPLNDALALLFIFFALPGACILIAIVFRMSGMPFYSVLRNVFMPAHLASGLFLHLSLSAAYIMSYPASQAVCPSLTILLIVGHAMPRGCTQEEIQRHFSNSFLLDTRFQDLNDAKLVKEVNSALTLTSRGIAITRFFVFYRRLLGLPMGDG